MSIDIVPPLITGLVGVAGIAGSVIAARLTSRNALAISRETTGAERRRQFWEKKAAAYEDVIREMLLRRTQREYALSHGDISTGPPALEQIRRRSDDPEAVRIKALLLAYGSAEVLDAYEESEEATLQVALAANDLERVNWTIGEAQRLSDAGESTTHLEPLPLYQEAFDRLHALKAAALDVDQKLFDAISRELADRPEAVAPNARWVTRARRHGLPRGSGQGL